MFEIHGNTDGIKKTDIAKLQALYLMELDSTEFLPDELAGTIARFSAQLRRELAVYISRDGEIIDIVVGDNNTVSLPNVRLRRNENALSRIRVIHTHPEGTAVLSTLDLTALASLRLDAIAALGLQADGTINGVSAAFITGWDVSGEPTIEQTDVLPYERLHRQRWMEKIEDCDRAGPGVSAHPDEEHERAILIGIRDNQSFAELKALAETAGAIPVGQLLQKRPAPDGLSYIGAGKVKELSLLVQTLNAQLIIAQDELSGVQLHQLETETGVRVIDRTALILDIFAQRARTREGQLQVSLAQLSYQSTHLVGFGLSLSRLGGGIGTRGPGETKLEMDRRVIRRRKAQLKEQLDMLEQQRAIQKKRRVRHEIPTVALIGYTNVGKSTLFNALTKADVFVENQLFATLDATTRRMDPERGQPYLLSDTVGFISSLPTELVEAFQSTLEEAADAQLLLVLSDASNPDAVAQRQVVQATLAKLGADQIPVLEVLNKVDLARPEVLSAFPDALRISAVTGEGLDALSDELVRRLNSRRVMVRFHIPYGAMQAVSVVHDNGTVTASDYQPEELLLTAQMDDAGLQRTLKAIGAGIAYDTLEES